MPVPPQIAQNPFRMLGVCGNASLRERKSNLSRAIAKLRVGQSVSFPFDSAEIFTEICRTEEAAKRAESDLTLRDERIRRAQFWFVRATDKDVRALGSIRGGKLDAAMEVWAHTGNVSSWQNRMIGALILNDWPQVARLAGKIYGGDSAVTHELFALFDNSGATIDYQKFAEFFFGELRALAGTETLLDVLPANSAWREFVRAPETTPLIDKIRREIRVTTSVRGSNPEAALKYGENLESNTHATLRELARFFTKDKKEEPFAGVSDELAEELSLCALQAFANDGNDTENLRRAHKLQSRAQRVVAGTAEKSRIMRRGEELKKAVARVTRAAGTAEKSVRAEIGACELRGKTLASAQALWEIALPKIREAETALGVTNRRLILLCKDFAECIFACVEADTGTAKSADLSDDGAFPQALNTLRAGTSLLEKLSEFVAGTPFDSENVVPALDALRSKIAAIEAVKNALASLTNALMKFRVIRSLAAAEKLLANTSAALSRLKNRLGAESPLFRKNLEKIVLAAAECAISAARDAEKNLEKIRNAGDFDKTLAAFGNALAVLNSAEKIAAGTALSAEKIVPAREKIAAQIAAFDDDEIFIKDALADLEKLPASVGSVNAALDRILPHLPRFAKKHGAQAGAQKRVLVAWRAKNVLLAFVRTLGVPASGAGKDFSFKGNLAALNAAAGTLDRVRKLVAGTPFARRELDPADAEISALIGENYAGQARREAEEKRRKAEEERRIAAQKAKWEAKLKAAREAAEKKRAEAEAKRKAEEAAREAAEKRAAADIDLWSAAFEPKIAAALEFLEIAEQRIAELCAEIGAFPQIFRRVRTRAAKIAISFIKTETDTAGTPNENPAGTPTDFDAAENARCVLKAAAEALKKIRENGENDFEADFVKTKIEPALAAVNARIAAISAIFEKFEKSVRNACQAPLPNFDAVENLLEIVWPALRRAEKNQRGASARKRRQTLAATAVSRILSALEALAYAANVSERVSRARIVQGLTDLRRAAELLTQLHAFADEMNCKTKKINKLRGSVYARISVLETALKERFAETPKSVPVKIAEAPKPAEAPKSVPSENSENVPAPEPQKTEIQENSVPVPEIPESVPVQETPEIPESVPAEAETVVPAPELPRAEAEEEKLDGLLSAFARRVESLRNAEELLLDSAALLRALRAKLGVENPQYLRVSERVAEAALHQILRATERFRFRENMSDTELAAALRQVNFAAETLRRVCVLDTYAIFKNERIVPAANDFKERRATFEKILNARNAAARTEAVPAQKSPETLPRVPAGTPQKTRTNGGGIVRFFRRIFSD